MLVVLSASSTLFSQTTVLNTKGDTTLCFTVPQAKFLLKEHYRAEECDTLKKICEKQLAYSDSVMKSDKKIQSDQSSIIKNKDGIIALQDYQIDELRKSLSLEQKATRRQKTYKTLAIISGSISTGFMSYLYLTK